jgi:hypothetical protein
VHRHALRADRPAVSARSRSRDGFVEHIAHLRSIVASGTVRVLDEFRDGPRYADRHVVEILKLDGSRVEMEVYVFGEFAADGRFRRVEETTLMLSGAEADRGLGSAR